MASPVGSRVSAFWNSILALHRRLRLGGRHIPSHLCHRVQIASRRNTAAIATTRARPRPPITITVTDFSLSANPSNINISAPGQSGTSTITLTPLGGFTGTVNLTCPPFISSGWGISCTFSPQFSVTGSSPATATLIITTGPSQRNGAPAQLKSATEFSPAMSDGPGFWRDCWLWQRS